MSFLNDLLGAVTGGGQQAAGAAGGSQLVSVAGQLIQQAGGVQGLVGMLEQHGLGQAASSWVGSGANAAISPDQLGQALQNGGLGSALQQAAGSLGVDQGQLLGQLAQVLPHAVDHLTPDGQAPAAGGGFDIGQLAGLAEKLLASRTA